MERISVKNKKYRVVSLFAGIGGLDLGFDFAGFNVIWANDFDKYMTYTMAEGWIQLKDAQNNNVEGVFYREVKTTDATGINFAELNPIRYRGYYYDSETGLYYLQSRYYNPEMGRFICADAFAATGQGFVGNNMFAYCENNGATYYDPSGTLRTYCVRMADGGPGNSQYEAEKQNER